MKIDFIFWGKIYRLLCSVCVVDGGRAVFVSDLKRTGKNTKCRPLF
jgi:hypothetical protein